MWRTAAKDTSRSQDGSVKSRAEVQVIGIRLPDRPADDAEVRVGQKFEKGLAVFGGIRASGIFFDVVLFDPTLGSYSTWVRGGSISIS